jgi:two-component system, OmpR family, sensor histidine kinase ChvG
MASATDIATRERRRRRRPVSPLTLRILAVNLLALAIPVAGLLYLGHYQDRLIQTELKALTIEARVFASALGEGAMASDDMLAVIDPEAARGMVRRLVETTETRTRLYGLEGRLIVDSVDFSGAFNQVQVQELPPPVLGGPFGGLRDAILALGATTLPGGDHPLYREDDPQAPSIRAEVVQALDGEDVARAWRNIGVLNNPRLVLTVAVPVQRYRQVQGAVLLMRGSESIDAAVRSVRADILSVFGVTLAITVLLSVYLAGTIARPIRRLAQAADRLRAGHRRHAGIPDFTARRDEIGDLSGVLRGMVEALGGRMDAIERFAADVAHEIKNPLTSLRSAVETAGRIDDPERRARLMAIIADDVRRLDRLITDISRASRLDAELNRAEPEPVDLGELLAVIADCRAPVVADGEGKAAPPRVVFERPRGEALTVPGLPGRLSQVFDNLIANAASFSPPGGIIRIAAGRSGEEVVVTVSDEGPGIPEGKERAIFDRFYSERPAGEKFGTHSGLGLSISRQIVEAHNGSIDARNRRSPDGRVLGAVFTVRLPQRIGE